MSGSRKFPALALQRCESTGARPTKLFLTVSIARQTLFLFGRERARDKDAYQLLAAFPCSTSKFGIGEKSGSQKTPRGLHRIAEKIGGGCPIGTIFKARQPVGLVANGQPAEAITTRIMWLEGLEPDRNRGGDVDSHERYIYIHGTGDESTIGRPASHGCIHLAASVLVPLYDQLPGGTLVWISARG